MEPRTGKTRIVIDFAAVKFLQGQVSRVLVIAPLNAMDVWRQELEARCPVSFDLVLLDKRGRRAPEMPSEDRLLNFVVINYDALSTPGRRLKSGGRSRRRGGRWDSLRLIQGWDPDLIVLDESHRISTPTARRTRSVLRLKAPWRIIATGTVVTKKRKVHGLYTQWKFLNPSRFSDVRDEKGKITSSAFKNRYSLWTHKHGFPQWLKNINLTELKSRIHKDAFSITRDECFDLPKAQTQLVWIDLRESRRHYDEMANHLITQFQEEGWVATASNKLVQILRLQQITSGFLSSDEGKKRVGREKLQVFTDLISDLAEAEEKVVVGARFVKDIEDVTEVCRKLGIHTYQHFGQLERLARDLAVKRFTEGPSPAVIVCQPQTAALAIDLSAAAIMVWYSLTHSHVDWSQLCDRIALSRRQTNFIYLLAKGTVDMVMYRALLEDKNLVDWVSQNPRLLRPETLESIKRVVIK
jgi:SNF2 family DNA or RNA helicase